jgi:hypothetical protein
VGLDEKGSEVLQFIVSLQTGDYKAFGSSDPVQVKGAALVNGLSISEMFKVLASENRHMKDGLFIYLSGNEISLHDSLMVRTDTLRVFTGSELSTDE